VPSLSRKYLAYSWTASPYRPQWTEITITVATFAAMAMLYMLFSKFIPIISVWELKAGQHPVATEEMARLADGQTLLADELQGRSEAGAD